MQKRIQQQMKLWLAHWHWMWDMCLIKVDRALPFFLLQIN
jgi:hypothetical protein